MYLAHIFEDGLEYKARKHRDAFTPPDISLKQLRDAVPARLYKRSTTKSAYHVMRNVFITCAFYSLGLYIRPFVAKIQNLHPEWACLILFCFRPLLWLMFWAWQGFAFAGLWCLGHEAGHHALFDVPVLNVLVGLVLHTFVLTPYHAWAITHSNHHRSTNNLHHDETYHPMTRRDLKLPDDKVAVKINYLEILEETPACTLFKLFIRQFLGFQLYLLHNRKGNPKYPAGTSHYNPNSGFFRPKHRRSILMSNGAILGMLYLLYSYGRREGFSEFCFHYLMPWLFAHNWIVTFTYLQHCDPTIPYYRKDQWTFARGALATVDRPIFGWVGRVLLHNISSDHVAHHFFPKVPFYNLPQVTEAIKPVLGDYYNYDSTPVLRALWRSFTQCIFIEDGGDLVFFKNRFGDALITPSVDIDVGARSH